MYSLKIKEPGNLTLEPKFVLRAIWRLTKGLIHIGIKEEVPSV